VADEWYYTQQGQQQGPVAAAQLKQLAVSGRLLPTDLVWKEGLANWVPASSARGLFPQSPASGAVAPGSGRTAGSGGAPSSGRTSASSGAPASGRPRPGPIAVTPIDDDDYEEAPLERRLQRKWHGLSTGVWIAIIGGSVGTLILIVGVILVFSLTSSGDSYTTPPIPPGQRDSRSIPFEAGRLVEITVTSDHNATVDLFIFDPHNTQVTAAVSMGPKIVVRFMPMQTGNYRLDVVNKSNVPNRSYVRYRQKE